VSREECTITTHHGRRGRARPRRAGMLCTLVLAGLLSACDPRDSTLDAVAPQADSIASLSWFIFILGTVVYVVVMALVAVPIVRSRRDRRRHHDGPGRTPGSPASEGPASADPAPAAVVDGEREANATGLSRFDVPMADIEDEPLAQAPDAPELDSAADRRVRGRLLWWGGIILPALILAVLMVASSMTNRSVAHIAGDDDLVIDVIGHMFWWEVHYPDLGITTANEIHVPVDQPVRLNLTTEDVIHSFWIPRVHGKVDMIPGSENIMTFTVEQPGRYRGHCAEFCGIAHAQMVKFLVAEEQEDFDAWVEARQQPAGDPADDDALEGQQVFFEYGCAECHTVDGHGAVGREGPDLTDLASRDSLASGIVPNDRAHLEELIVDPWGLKAGNPMPPTAIEGEDLDRLLDYLEGLE
jgi:cytochrome c oxidase subunit II